MLAMFLAGMQYTLGDLEADATPRPRGSTQFDMALAAMTSTTSGRIGPRCGGSNARSASPPRQRQARLMPSRKC